MGKKKKMPCYRSRIQGRCEELAKKLSEVSSDYHSALGALKEIRDEAFAEGYERKGFDLRYQKEMREEKRKKEWVKLRDKIIFRGK